MARNISIRHRLSDLLYTIENVRISSWHKKEYKTTKNCLEHPFNGNWIKLVSEYPQQETDVVERTYDFCLRARAPPPPNFLGSIRLGSAIKRVRSYATNFFFNAIAL